MSEAIPSRENLAALATPVFGSGRQTRLSTERDVNIRTVQRRAKDGISKPSTAVGIRAYLLSRRIFDVPPRPEGDAILARPLLERAFQKLGCAAAAIETGWSSEDMVATGAALAAACGSPGDVDKADTRELAA